MEGGGRLFPGDELVRGNYTYTGGMCQNSYTKLFLYFLFFLFFLNFTR